MNFLSPITGLLSLVAAAPMLFIGAGLGIFGYRYMLIKNPTLLNTLVSKAKTDIEGIEALISKKKAALPKAAPAPAAVAPAAPVLAPAPAVAAVTSATAATAALVVAQVAAPVAVAPAVVPVAPVAPAVPAAPVVAAAVPA
jgi:hypothetical protein